MSELSELIEINKNIEKQNEEIIRLLKVIAGENESQGFFGYVYPQVEEKPPEIDLGISPDDSLLDVEISVGEVYFIDGDIFRLTVKNNEKTIDNLIGDGETTNYNVAEVVANESIKRNQSLEDSTVILTDSSKGMLPQTLKVCHEQGAEYVFIPWNQLTELIGAPDTLQRLLKLNFYKTEEDLIEKLFREGE